MPNWNQVREKLTAQSLKRWFGVGALTIATAVGVQHIDSSFLLGSVLDFPSHDPFDGTVMPVEKGADWARLSSDQYYWTYDEFLQNAPDKLVEVPLYDNDLMTYDSDRLGWRSQSDLDIRTFKSTYPVGYLDNYDYSDDSGDYTGGHNGIDIKLPQGTPLRSVANGVVIRSGWSSGYGNTVVVMHRNVPHPDDPSETTTLYSSYSHNEENLVEKGDVVHKGEVIARTGTTGTSTTYHIHFQLDGDDAPFYPYWPFTSKEVADAGVNFWEAVNIGLGRENSEKYSFHPLNWVNANLDEDFEFSEVELANTTTEDDVELAEEEDEDNKDDEVAEEDQEPTKEESAVIYTDFDDIEIETPKTIVVGQTNTLTLKLLDEDGDWIKKPEFTGTIRASLSKDLGSLSQKTIDADDFNSGKATLKLYAEQEGDLFVTLTYSGREHYSEYMNLFVEQMPFDHFIVATDGSFGVGKVETVQIQAVDENGQLTKDVPENVSIKVDFSRGTGNLSQNTITEDDFVKGIAEVQFRGKHNEIMQVRARYNGEELLSGLLTPSLYSDVNTDDDFYPAVNYLYKAQVMSGYPDGTARLNNSISRVEVLKMIFEGVSLSTSNASVSFPDTEDDAWYSPYLGAAYEEGIVAGYPDGSFKPTQGVTRVEFLKMLTLAASRSSEMNVTVDPVVLKDSFNDVDRLSWYAPYVHYADSLNLFPVDGNNFKPGQPMTRGEVAEVIYRLIVSQENGGVEYSALLSVADPQ